MNNDRLKFRFWYKNGGYILDDDGNIATFVVGEPLHIDHNALPDEIEQCTGLRDKANNLAFHNDLVQFPDGTICKIVWETDSASFYLIKVEDGKEYYFADASHIPETKIIGNIHQEVKE
jgi:hypothetical protein